MALKVCIIGASGHYNYALEGLQEEESAAIAALAPGSEGEDIDELVTACAEYSPAVYEDCGTMLTEVQPDVAVINSYFCDHARIASAALAEDIHVFVEKPVATTLDDLRSLQVAYEDSAGELAAMFGSRYEPWFLTAYEALDRGVVGDIRLVTAQKSYRLGERGPNYREREFYGGTIPWVGSHAIDWIWWMVGKNFRKVYATHSRQYNRDHGDLELSALCHFELEDEIFAGVNIDYLRPQAAPTHGDDRIRIAGTAGVLEVFRERVYLTDERAEGTRELALRDEGQIFADFLRQIRGDKSCMVSANDSFYVTEASLLARKSADSGEVIRF